MAEAMQEADEHGAMEVEVDNTPAPDSQILNKKYCVLSILFNI